MKIVGYEQVQFEGSDGKVISGYNLHLVGQANRPGVQGLCTDNTFISDWRLNQFGYTVAVDDEVQIFYTKNAKTGKRQVAGIYKIPTPNKVD